MKGGATMFTIRKLIPQLKQVNSNRIVLSNGGIIYIFIGNFDDSYVKIIDSKKIYKTIECRIDENVNLIPEIGAYYEPQGDRYILPERIMNQLITANGGIDAVKTINDVYYASHSSIAQNTILGGTS